MNIQLKPFTDADIEQYIVWLNSDHVKPWYSPVDEWIEEVNKRESEFNWIRHYIILAEETPIGFCQFYPYWRSGEDWNGDIPVEETYSIDYLIGEVKYLCKGYASKALKQLNAIIFNRSDAKRIIVQPEECNIASRKTLLSAGFTYDEKNKLFIINRN